MTRQYLAEWILQEQMDIISHLCDNQYLSLIEGESGSALLAFQLQSSNTEGSERILRQDHPAVRVQVALPPSSLFFTQLRDEVRVTYTK